MQVILWVVAIFTLHYTTVEACLENETCKINLEDKNIQALLTGMETFTDKLLRAVYTDSYIIGNIAISPLSIYFSLATMLLGSTDKTLASLNEALNFPVDTDWQVIENNLKAILDALEVFRSETIDSKKVVYENVFLGQAVFLQSGFKLQSSYEQFLKLIGADYCFVDFTIPENALQLIKEWVATQTSKRVNVGVENPFPPTSGILFASTVFFTAKWEDGLFPKDKHGTGKFFTLPQKKIIEVGTMSTTSAKTLQYLDVPGYYSSIMLPYKGGDNVMLIVLPNQDYDIGNFALQFGMKDYDYIIKNAGPTLANVTIPKFIGVWTATFARYLIRMGLKDLFQDAQLGNMIQDFQGGIEVAELLHAAAMELDESGTTVSTISVGDSMYGASAMSLMSVEETVIPIEFIVNRPFYMYVHNIQTGLPIFAALMRSLGGD